MLLAATAAVDDDDDDRIQWISDCNADAIQTIHRSKQKGSLSRYLFKNFRLNDEYGIRNEAGRLPGFVLQMRWHFTIEALLCCLLSRCALRPLKREENQSHENPNVMYAHVILVYWRRVAAIAFTMAWSLTYFA